MTERSTTRRLLGREQRQAQLLQAAATAFARAGFAATSMDDVAAEAGVTKLIVYRHFASKDELYRAILTKVADRLRAELRSQLHLTWHDKVPGFATRALLTVARENPDGFCLLTRHARREPEFAALARGFLDDGLAAADVIIGDMIPTEVKAWAAPVIVDYLVHGVITWLDVGDESRDDEFVALATRGLRGLFLAWADPARISDEFRDVLDQEPSV